jgi:hypothetical protein
MVTQGSPLQTEFSFTLPLGYVDSQGKIHRNGTMRLASAMDEIAPMRDARVRENQAYLTIVILSRVINRLGDIIEVSTNTIEKLFTADLAYLQDFYRQINSASNGQHPLAVTCPNCKHTFQVNNAAAGGSGGES